MRIANGLYKRSLKGLFITVLLLAQVIPFTPVQNAYAAPQCVNDQQGANDEPGEKDLTRSCVDTVTGLTISWSWDRVDFGNLGGNTGDACSLFDTDGDGKANKAICVSVDGNPGVQIAGSPLIYTCNDSKFDRCAGDVLVAGPYLSSCSVSTTNTQPFGVGEGAPNDTTATCTVNAAEFTGTYIDTCSYPSNEINSNPFDCIILKPGQSKLEVKKVLIPSGDSGTFDLRIDSVTKAAAVGNGGTTGEVSVAGGSNHTVSELGAGATVLANYTGSISCSKDNGTAQPFIQANDVTTLQIDGSHFNDQDIVCMITNTKKQTNIEVKKVLVNDNGGTKAVTDFGFSVNGGPRVAFEADGSNIVQVQVGGTYTITETEANTMGYTTTYSSCTNVQSSLTATPICTITNNDVAPSLTLQKNVINDNGGTKTASDWTMSATGSSQDPTNISGSGSVSSGANFKADSYTLAESGPSTYIASAWSCTNGVMVTNQTIQLPIGTTTTCTITNDDKPASLVVTKLVTNDNGGSLSPSDFTMNVSGTNVSSSSFAGSSAGTTVQLDAGLFSVTEQQVSGYEMSGYTGCTGTIAVGEIKYCTITNNDIAPKLTVTKIVANDPNNGTLSVSDFPLYVTNDQSGVQEAVVSGIQETFSAGNYTVSETNAIGYVATISGDCSATGTISLQIGQTYACTITNTAQPAQLTVVKTVTNDNGGSKTASDFSFTVGGDSYDFDADGSVTVPLPAGIYTVAENEANADGYATEYVGSCSQVVLTNGGSATCYITNDDVAPSLTLKKEVSNDYGNSRTASEWTLTASDNAQQVVLSGSGQAASGPNFAAGTYTISESGPSDYKAGDWSCSNGVTVTEVDTISLSIGQSTVCTITNYDQAATITVTKTVINDDGGSKRVEDFSFSLNGQAYDFDADGSVSVAVPAGTYTVEEVAANTDGYVTTYTGCSEISVTSGQTATCSIENDDTAPVLTLEKKVVNDNGGAKTPADWTLTATPDVGDEVLATVSGNGTADSATGGVESVAIRANTDYLLSESTIAGYTNGSWSCEGGELNGNTFTAAPGTSAYCAITNDDIAPTLSLKKIVIDDFGGLAEPEDWTLTATPMTEEESVPTISGNGNLSPDNLLDVDQKEAVAGISYKLSEKGPDGYSAADSWVCSGEGDFAFDEPDMITLQPGADITCSVVNTSVAPKVTVIKKVINDNGGVKTAGDFTISIDGTDVSESSFAGSTTGTTVYMDSGEYMVYEEEAMLSSMGYAVSYSESCKGTITVGEEAECVITNDDIAPEVIVHKYTRDACSQWYDAANVSCPSDSFSFTVTNNGQQYATIKLSNGGTYDTGSGLDAGTVSITEAENADWFLAAAYCLTGGDDESFLEYSPYNLTVEIGKTYECVFVNEKYSTVTVTKYHDYNENGWKDADEPTLPDWEFNLEAEADGCISVGNLRELVSEECYFENPGSLLTQNKSSDTMRAMTDEEGTVTFKSLTAGGYRLYESQQDDWQLSGIYCSYENDDSEGYRDYDSYRLYLYPGEQVTCFVGNHRVPVLKLQKQNDKPNPVNRNTVVTYTMIVSVPEEDESGRVYGAEGFCEEVAFSEEAVAYDGCSYDPVTVVDLPPQGFTYIPGSFTAFSSVRGDLKEQGITTDPAYASPGSWLLTSASSNFLAPGEIVTLTYKATVGSAVSEGRHPDTAFAYGYTNSWCGCDDTARIYANSNENPFVGTSVRIIDPVVSKGEVLGLRLVNTGQAGYLQLISGALLLLLGVLFLKKNGKRSLIPLVAAIITGSTLLGGFGNAHAASPITLKLQSLESPNNDSTTSINYQVITTDPTNDFTIELFQNGNVVSTQEVTKDYGNSGTFTINMPADGAYTFVAKATVVSGTDTGTVVSSNSVPYVLDRKAPTSVATSPVVVRNGNTYTITFTVNGDASDIVEIHASTTPSFTISSSTKVGEVAVMPNQQQSFTYAAPDDTRRYFAVVTRDQAGNLSSPTGEADVVSVGLSSTSTVAPDAGVAAESTEAPENTSSTATTQEQPAANRNTNTRTLVLVFVTIALLSAALYAYQRRKVSAEQ